MRLDQQNLHRYHLLDRDGRPRYGTIQKTEDRKPVVLDGAKPIVFRGAAPFVTVREETGHGRVVWLGVDRLVAQLQNQLVRDLIKRSLVSAQGYAVYAGYGRSAILFTDDWGTSDKTYLPYWHYKHRLKASRPSATAIF